MSYLEDKGLFFKSYSFFWNKFFFYNLLFYNIIVFLVLKYDAVSTSL